MTDDSQISQQTLVASPLVGCYRLLSPSSFIITQPESWYSFTTRRTVNNTVIQYVVSLVPSLQRKRKRLGITILINDKSQLKRNVEQIGFQLALKTSKSLS